MEKLKTFGSLTAFQEFSSIRKFSSTIQIYKKYFFVSKSNFFVTLQFK